MEEFTGKVRRPSGEIRLQIGFVLQQDIYFILGYHIRSQQSETTVPWQVSWTLGSGIPWGIIPLSWHLQTPLLFSWTVPPRMQQVQGWDVGLPPCDPGLWAMSILLPKIVGGS